MASADTDDTPRSGAEEVVALLESGIAENKAQLAKRSADLARLLGCDGPVTPGDWRLAQASIALTLGILATEDDQVERMLRGRDDEIEDWLLETLRPRGSGATGRNPSRRRSKRRY